MAQSTLQQLAEQLNLAKSTVSMVLNHDARARVSEKRKQEIFQLAARMDYRPSHVAASLRRRRTKLLGMVVSDVRDLYFANLIEAGLHFCEKRGYQLLFSITRNQPELEQRGLQTLLTRDVEGIFYSPSLLQNGTAPESLHGCRVPILLRGDHADGFLGVQYDRKQALLELVADFRRRGAKKILILPAVRDPELFSALRAEGVTAAPYHIGDWSWSSCGYDAIYVPVCSEVEMFAGQNGKYRPMLATVYTFPEDRIDSKWITGCLINPFYSMVDQAMNLLMDRAEKKPGPEILCLPCQYLPREEFARVAAELPDTLEKYERAKALENERLQRSKKDEIALNAKRK